MPGTQRRLWSFLVVMQTIRLESICLNLDLVTDAALVSSEGKGQQNEVLLGTRWLRQPNDSQTLLASTCVCVPHPQWKILACHADQIFGRSIFL